MQPQTFPDEWQTRRRKKSIRVSTYIYLGLFFIATVLLTHLTLVSMPYFWDEAGYYIPATWDFFQEGRLLPHSATPNVHPPAVMAWVSLAWKTAWPGVEVSRVAMMLVGAFFLLASFMLAVELCGSLPGLPAFFAVLALGCSPLVYTQSMLVQLDLPAAALTALAMYLFLVERQWGAVLACCALVLTKETGVLLPVVLGAWLASERRFRRAAMYLIPVAALAAWIVFVRMKTGNWLGSDEFSRYNLTGTIGVSQIGLAMARRLYFVFIGNFHWVATLGILAGWREGLFRRRRWAVAFTFCGLHLVMVSVLGGAVLERYMVPALPVFYTAAVAGFGVWGAGRRWLAYSALVGGLVAGLFINPLLWPFPFENNMAMVTFTRLHARVATTIETQYRGARVASIWPMTAELKDPRLGYVQKPVHVLELPDLTTATMDALDRNSYDIVVRFSRDWDPDYNLLRHRIFRFVARRNLGFKESVSTDELVLRHGLKLAHVWTEGGQWVEIYVR